MLAHTESVSILLIWVLGLTLVRGPRRERLLGDWGGSRDEIDAVETPAWGGAVLSSVVCWQQYCFYLFIYFLFYCWQPSWSPLTGHSCKLTFQKCSSNVQKYFREGTRQVWMLRVWLETVPQYSHNGSCVEMPSDFSISVPVLSSSEDKYLLHFQQIYNEFSNIAALLLTAAAVNRSPSCSSCLL